MKLRTYLQANLSYVTYFFSAATLSRCDLVLRRVRRERVGQVCPECGAKFSDAKEIPSAPLEGGRRLELALQGRTLAGDVCIPTAWMNTYENVA